MLVILLFQLTVTNVQKTVIKVCLITMLKPKLYTVQRVSYKNKSKSPTLDLYMKYKFVYHCDNYVKKNKNKKKTSLQPQHFKERKKWLPYFCHLSLVQFIYMTNAMSSSLHEVVQGGRRPLNGVNISLYSVL